jgi:ParB family chromosome partitioning protein
VTAKPRENVFDRNRGALEKITSRMNDKTLLKIEIDKIDPDPNNPRTDITAESIEELAASIRSDGLLQPIVVFKSGERYTIIAGHRRHLACRAANLDRIDVIVREPPRSIRATQLIENIQREDLNPLDVAISVRDLMAEQSVDAAGAAEALGKSKHWVYRYLRYLELPIDLQAMIRARLITSNTNIVAAAQMTDAERGQLRARLEAGDAFAVVAREMSKPAVGAAAVVAHEMSNPVSEIPSAAAIPADVASPTPAAPSAPTKAPPASTAARQAPAAEATPSPPRSGSNSTAAPMDEADPVWEIPMGFAKLCADRELDPRRVLLGFAEDLAAGNELLLQYFSDKPYDT